MVGGPPKSLRPLDHPNHSESPDPLPTPTNSTNSNSTTLIIKPPDQLDHHGQLSWSPWLPQPTDFSDQSLQPLWPPRPWTFSKFTEKTSWTICKFCNKVMQNAKLQKFFKKNVCYDNLHLSGKTICKICFRNVNLQKSCPECQIAKSYRFNIWSNYLIVGQWFNNG